MPILETIRVPDEEDVVILVMPLLRPCKDPPFETVGEVVEFFRQIFEVGHTWLFWGYSECLRRRVKGMLFMHQHRIAHRYAPSSYRVLVNLVSTYLGSKATAMRPTF